MTTASHYRLTSDEFLTINSKLTDAQLRVYLYYKTLDPFGDRRVEICTKAIAETLGITQRCVQIALNKLSSMGLLIWQKSKSFVMRSVDRLGERRIAEANVGSPRRTQDRERQLELSLQADSETSQSSSSLFKLDHDQEDDFENLENREISEISIEEDDQEISVDEAIAQIREAIFDNENDISSDISSDTATKKAPAENRQSSAENQQPLRFSDEEEEPQEFEEILKPNPDLQLSTVGNTNGTSEGKPTRAAVENFVLKTLNKTFPNESRRAAYFGKFNAASWKKWETDYKASLISPAPYKPYIPEKVEVAAPDSPVAQSAIAQIKAKLGIKS